ncbi:MAG: transcription-repair coupling factor [Verrucomicrobiae bacterium]|nr:transcription-repair coupling factor [Verrucomicrobiae bacterium]
MLADQDSILHHNPRVKEWSHSVLAGEVYPLGYEPLPYQAYLIASLVTYRPQVCLVICRRFKEMEELAAHLEVWLNKRVVQLFPWLEIGESVTPDPDFIAQRYRTLQRLLMRSNSSSEPLIILTLTEALEQKLPSPAWLKERQQILKVGQSLSLTRLQEQLTQTGFLRVTRIDQQGQFAQRGGILDIYPYHSEDPVRIEFFGDEIDSMREFSIHDQLKLRDISSLNFFLANLQEAPAEATLYDYLFQENKKSFILDSTQETLPSSPPPTGFSHDFLKKSSADLLLQEQRRANLLEHLQQWTNEDWRMIIFCHNEGETQRLKEILEEQKKSITRAIIFSIGHLNQGFTVPEAKLAILTDAEIFGRYRQVRSFRLRERTSLLAQSRHTTPEEWEIGDYVVHAQHGIGRFCGLKHFALHENQEQEVIILEYAEGAKLYVPLNQAYLISRYVGVSRKKPTLDSLGGNRWERAKIAANRAIFDYAAKLLQIQAERQIHPSYSFPPDTEWQREFEASFIYQETSDQLLAIEASKQDMENPTAMDRLICGDVGFGKTEVAIRAAFKAVMSGKQVAFLCPTTVLAQQHGNTLRERMADYPVKIEILSRFASLTAQKKIVNDLAKGEVDIVVGTHRLLSLDVKFKDIGLLVVDEEQRFGVKHKETLKERFRQIDILTLSATPIPRTLYLALMGARDMSTIETPPPGRVPVETAIAPYDERLIRDAIQRELARDGQVFFLHNRVESIERMALKIQRLIPGIKVIVGHGQMKENELEQVMLAFVEGKADVLVSTTIIESGLDIPNANTIIIDRADRFGLADLYQLRGRVGRGQHKAYAYLLLPRELLITGEARRRTSAIKQYSHLGAGFKIAMRDLEIRGAGNLLGTQQSGHIAAIGFELYCQLLKMAIEQLKTGKPIFRRDVSITIDFLNLNESEKSTDQLPAYLPISFLPEPGLRIEAYRELAEISNFQEWKTTRKTWEDRFGRLPEAVENLLQYTRLKILCSEHVASSLEIVEDQVRIKKGGDYILIDSKFPRLTEKNLKKRFKEIFYWAEQLLEENK